MKKLLSLLFMVITSIGVNAQAVIAEVDWTQESDYYNDMWYTAYSINYSVTSEGLVIENLSDDWETIWRATIPIIEHIKELKAGRHYQVKLTIDAPCSNETRLDISGEQGCYLWVEAGEHEYTVDFQFNAFQDVTDAYIMYQCGYSPGKHVIKKVQVIDLEAGQEKGIIYNYDADNKTAEVKGISKYSQESIEIPNTVIHEGKKYTVTKIGEGAFQGCKDLIVAKIPSSVIIIGSKAFAYCTNLAFVDIPNSVFRIDEEAFYGCSSLISINLPENLYRIGRWAFSNCSSLVSLDIPGGIPYISDHAFAGCTSLVSVTFRNCLTNLSESVFYGCRSLSDIKIVVSDYYSFCQNAILSQLKKENVDCPITLLKENGDEIQEVKIPELISSIGFGAFYNCKGITSVSIHNGVTSIGESAFENCSNITSVSIPNSVTSIGARAFYNCAGLTSFVLPYDLSMIKKQTFYGCTNLEAISIPASVEYIFQEAFAKCDNLQQVTALPKIPPFMFANSFSNYDAILKVPDSSIDQYKSTDPWSRFKMIVTTSIQNPSVDHHGIISDSPFYDLNGRRVQGKPKKGVYIQNGVKRVVR
ncbi:MAG: leucine-rich repeat domain-containing protein [Prevotella sp.]|nr:leucine-rich repeat domain-containing protein [Prevotella sp.]